MTPPITMDAKISTRSLPSGALLCAVLFAAACGGGGGGGGSGGQGVQVFELDTLTVPDRAVWQVNREIRFTFTQPVDFATVSLNTIRIRSTGGVPAIGTFFFAPVDLDGDGVDESVDETTIVFQPACPTRADFADAGLRPGGVAYTIEVVGLSSQTSNTVRSETGAVLGTTQVRRFRTPQSNQASSVFLDTVSGPPLPVLRGQGSSLEEATRVELADDPDQRVYFEVDPVTQDIVLSIPDFELPLNFYSDASSHVAVVIEFNQPVNPSASNVNSNRLRLEYLDSSQVWQPLGTTVQLVANCTRTGATVRLEPQGVLPQASELRAVIRAGFQDLVGVPHQDDFENFALAPTLSDPPFTNLDPPDVLSDEFREEFDFGGAGPNSFEDSEALFEAPRAVWEDGSLEAAFSFEGGGGPDGEFDWRIRAGEKFIFDTVATQIVGGPDGLPTDIQNTVGGVVDVRNLLIEEGGELRVQGPNTMRINASGDVIIRGVLEVSGFAAKDVATLNTGNQPETGGAGAAAGGRGGHANEITTNSTPRGGTGHGPFAQPGLGGQGGETGYNPSTQSSGGKDARRPGGGGGGRFSDHTSPASLTAGRGFNGHPRSTGAESGVSPAAGGFTGTGAFVDDDPENDFFGVRPIVDVSGELLELVRGELPRLWAGYGGGGGGNAVPASSFPHPRWSFNTDEKGGGGGGGGGGVHIRALGKIIFGPVGQIRANGAQGATGENTNFLDHVGGTGGSGSGGHVVLESASLIDFTGGDAAVVLHDCIRAVGGPLRTGPVGGAAGGGEFVPANMSYGGPGGAGVIQLHVPDALLPPGSDPNTADIILPDDALLEPDPLDEITSPPAYVLIPTFGARSAARSLWIPLGGADQNPAGPEDLVTFLFGGVQTDPGPSLEEDGKVLTSDGVVVDLPAVLGPLVVGLAGTAIQPDGNTLVVSGQGPLDSLLNDSTNGVSNDVYLRAPALMRDFVLRMDVQGNPQLRGRFNVIDASYDEAAFVLTLRVEDNPDGDLLDFVDRAGSGAVIFRLIPRFFRVVTDGVEGALPDSSFVRIRFQGASADAIGNPDEANLLQDWTGDISKFNDLPDGALQFFRFQVEFDLDAQSAGLTVDTDPIQIDFLRVPFRF